MNSLNIYADIMENTRTSCLIADEYRTVWLFPLKLQNFSSYFYRSGLLVIHQVGNKYRKKYTKI